MSLYKRGGTWWTDFSVNGARYRQSLDTTDWREAQSKEKELITQASTGKLAPIAQQFSRLAFAEAPTAIRRAGWRISRHGASLPSVSA